MTDVSPAAAQRPIRVGLVGGGTIAQLAQLPVLSQSAGVTIAGLVTASHDQTDDNLARWPIERGYDTVDDLIDGGNLDALFVLTPKHLHTPFVRAGLDAGLDVFCEKPLASTLEDAAALVSAAEDAAGLLMVAFNRRYAPVYVQARAQFAEAPPRFVVGQKHRAGSEYRATLENGIHMVDLLRWFCGEAIDVAASADATDPYREDGTAALIRFDTGSTALFLAARSAGEWDERLDAYGDLTTVRVVAPDSIAVTRDGTTSVTEMRPREHGWADITRTAGFRPAIDHFLECVRTRSEPRTSALEAYRSQELMERILAVAGLPTVEES
ncbi:MAG: Gfo/Idh/MocA family oxidoreductase [Actinomycetota bacterium]|nr:Gfo/Idh/MocA family oxidoreductase [Actinomycetota bacterium]